ncbi:MAG: hypothetical protein PUP91_11170 [Rhizonema sp. PD37]|nr:hypothetical protein [Rhizonema sp. PD37]
MKLELINLKQLPQRQQYETLCHQFDIQYTVATNERSPNSGQLLFAKNSGI